MTHYLDHTTPTAASYHDHHAVTQTSLELWNGAWRIGLLADIPMFDLLFYRLTFCWALLGFLWPVPLFTTTTTTGLTIAVTPGYHSKPTRWNHPQR
jgi:hypothetical protein